MAKSTWGSLSHVGQWLYSPWGEQFIENPGFNPAKEDEAIVIVFIHGTADRACGGGNFSRRFFEQDDEKQEEALKPVPDAIKGIHLVAFEERYLGKGIDDFARQLNYQMVNKYHYKNIFYVGHSRGALIAGRSAQLLSEIEGINIRIWGVFSICGPYQASYLAGRPLAYFSDSVAQMGDKEGYLRELCETISEKPACPYFFIVGENDWIVTQDGVVPGYLEQHPNALYVITEHSHLSILQTTRLKNFVREQVHSLVENRKVIELDSSVTPTMS